MITWVQTDREVLFDEKVKFRALHSGEKGYIEEGTYDDGFVHIALVEV